MKKSLFISYSNDDSDRMRIVEKIANESGFLEPVIIADKREAASHLSEKVKAGIIRCDYFVPILTQKSISTQWINQEIGFATAIRKNIRPITENHILDNLKGFIHKQVDLPYTFDGITDNKRLDRQRFRISTVALVTDILLENNLIPQINSLYDLFPGTWENKYQGPNPSRETFEITENKYYYRNKPWFDITHVKIDLTKRKMRFKKVGLKKNNDNRVFKNVLKIIELGKYYEGNEIDINGREYHITYSRVK